MNPSLEETIVLDFITSSSTGAAADADSLPTAEVFEDANDTAILSPTVTKRTSKTGNYRVPVACTAANGFEAGKSYNVIASATIGGVAAKAKVGTFQIRTRDTDDAAVPGSAMTLTGGERTTLVGLLEAEIADDSTGAAVKQAIIDKLIENLPSLDDLTLAAIATAVWGNVTRTLSAGTNIVLAKGVGVTGFNDITVAAVAAQITTDHGAGSYVRNTEPLDAAGVRGAVGLGAANLDTQLADVPTVAEFNARTLPTASYATAAEQTKVVAAVYNSASRAGNVITLSNGATQTISATGRVTA